MNTLLKTDTVRLLVVDDHQIVLDSLRLLLGSMPGMELTGMLNNSVDVLPFLAEHEVDILVCDLHMPRQSGLELTTALRQRHPDVKVLLLTMAEDAATIREAVRAGVAGYVLKRTGRAELERAIQELMNGNRYFSQEIMSQLATLATDTLNPVDDLAMLTNREIEVLTLIASECSSQRIADQLFISIPTVETHRRHLMQKLGVKSVVGMVKFAMKHGLVR